MAEKKPEENINIRSRGVPPYKVYGAYNVEMGQRHFSFAYTFKEIVATLIDLTDRGEELRDQYASDAHNEIIFKISDPNDVKLLKQISFHPRGIDALIVT